MTPAILSSTFLLTFLLAIGLFFFIRASVKDRTEEVNLIFNQPADSVLRELETYFTQRAYHIVALDGATSQVTYEGNVQPSWFLAVFLSLLAGTGILCLSLVLAIVFPQIGSACLVLLGLAPAAGWFYWQGAGRNEQVLLKVQPATTLKSNHQTTISIRAHRDEISELTKNFPLTSLD